MIIDPRESKRRLMLRLKGVSSRESLIGPATVQFHLTNQCNLACQYCYYHAPESRFKPTEKIHFPVDVFVRVVHELVDLKVDGISLSGQGEPTLHPHFCELLDFLEQQPLFVTIFSNGTFPLEFCHKILRSADYIVINLGEASRSSYRALQGKDLFLKVIENIRELVRLRPQINPDFRIEVVFLETVLNQDSFLKTETLVKKIGVDVVRRKAAETFQHTNNIKISGEKSKEKAVREWRPCYHGWFYSSIRLNGDVNICCLIQRFVLGNVTKDSFKDIWKTAQYRQARISALTGDPYRDLPECRNCTLGHHNKKFHAQMRAYIEVKSNMKHGKNMTISSPEGYDH